MFSDMYTKNLPLLKAVHAHSLLNMFVHFNLISLNGF